MRHKSLIWGWKWGQMRCNWQFWRISSMQLWGHFTPNKSPRSDIFELFPALTVCTSADKSCHTHIQYPLYNAKSLENMLGIWWTYTQIGPLYLYKRKEHLVWKPCWKQIDKFDLVTCQVFVFAAFLHFSTF